MKDRTFFKRLVSVAFCGMCMASSMAQVTLNIDAGQRGASIGGRHYGIFFEEINHAGDGGLYAELIHNRSFEDNASNPDKWWAVGNARMAVVTDGMLNEAQEHALELEFKGAGDGVRNEGFWGIHVVNGQTYKLSFWIKGSPAYKGVLTAELQTEGGQSLGSRELAVDVGSEWTKLTAEITATGEARDGWFALKGSVPGTVVLDMVSLFPPTYKGRDNGCRIDLAEKLEAMKPSFVRFPGGCYVEGHYANGKTNRFEWKNTIGPIEERPGHMNQNWGYRVSDGFGFHEMLQLTEDLGAEPLFVVNMGMGHAWVEDYTRIDEYIQEALDAIEYCNGDAKTTKWGALRAKNGHPEPFNLRLLEIGNENYNFSSENNNDQSDHYAERYEQFRKAIKAKYPELIDRFNIPLDESPRRCVNQIKDWKEMSEKLLSDTELSHERSKEYASYIKDSMINELTELNRTLMLSIDVIPVPTDEAVREMQNRLLGVETNVTNWQRRQNSNNNFSAVVPYDLEQQRKETREMLDDLTTRDQRMMFAVVTLVHLADSKEELDSDTETLQSIARKHLCQLSTLNWQQAEGLVTALPLGLRRIDALRTLTTEALAVLMPFKAQEIRHQGGVYYGQNTISKNLILANRWELLNANGFVLGVSGSGKSFTAKREMVGLALAAENGDGGVPDDIIVIDPESEYRPLIEGLGGEVIEVSATSPNHINAMDMEQGYGDGENPVVLKSEFLLSLCEQLMGSGKLSAKEKSIIDRCAAQCYREYIRRGYTGAVPTLQDFHAELLRQPEPEARDVALAIELFTEGSLNTFAKPTNVDTNSRILCYDIRDLGRQLLPVGMLVVLDSIFNRIIRNRQQGRNTWIYIDEIYLLFQHEYSANFLFTLWKRVRKYRACCTGITQNVDDLLQSHTARTMLANSEFLVMLNQAATDRTELARLLNISDNQLSYITNVDSGRGLIKCGSAIVPFMDHFPKNNLYRLMSTKPSEADAAV